MSVGAHDAEVQQRVNTIVGGLDATMAVDATIGRTSPLGSLDDRALPLLSLDEGGHSHGARSTLKGAAGAADLQLVGVLGKGGMGVVYAARQRALDRDVAIKRPHGGDPSP